MVIFVLSWTVNERFCKGIMLFTYYQKKQPCFNLEMDTKVQVTDDISTRRKKALEFIVGEILIKVGLSDCVWLWISIESKKNNRHILALSIFKERNMHVCSNITLFIQYY